MDVLYTVPRLKRGLLLSVHFLNMPRFDSLSYHETELRIALDPCSPARAVPPIAPHYTRILDIGCGMGQTLIALNLPEHVQAFGVDCDRQAIEAGKRIICRNISLLCASGENLPFPDEYFDFIFSRLALPYADVQQVLREIWRTLKPGGDTWIALHSFSKFRRRFLHALSHGNIRQIAGCSYVLLNSLLFTFFGIQFSLMQRNETYQTTSGMKAALKSAGLVCTSVETGRFFIIRAVKLRPPTV